jgi:hypothetical protein
VPLTFTIKFTPAGGTVKYWNFHRGQPNMQPEWQDTLPTNYNRTIELECGREFNWSSKPINFMKNPQLNDGTD